MPSSVAQEERQALCALFEEKGPLAPTLCEGWTTADLAAHLYVRERKPLASPGIVLRPLAQITERAMERAKAELGYQALVQAIRTGPPLPWSLVDSTVNTLEYFVHHEDVRRADGGVEPREDERLDTALWALLGRMSLLFAARLRGIGLELVAPGFGARTVRSAKPGVVLRGGPQEIVLYLVGRKAAARVELEGSEEARARLQAAKLGI